MADPIDRRNLRVTGSHVAQGPGASGSINIRDIDAEPVIVVTQAFGPRGDSLIGLSDVAFDGHPAVTLKIRAGDQEGLIHLSPIHGDSRKAGTVDIAPGQRCELRCPVSDQPLDMVGEVEDKSGARYFAIYLTPGLSQGSMVMISDVWGHYHSRIIDDFELISAWAPADADGDGR